MKIFSYNINSLIKGLHKGFGVQMLQYDILLLQETKINPEDVPELEGLYSFWHCSESKRGYSGVSLHSKIKPDNVFIKFDSEMDDEGRFIAADFGDLRIVNIYTPNAKDDCSRMEYQMEFCLRIYEKFFTNPHQKILFVGDINLAHQPTIDVGTFTATDWWNNPVNGTKPEQVAGLDRLESDYGFVDLYRLKHPGALYSKPRTDARPDNYKDMSWFSSQTFAKARGLGWRVDYMFASWALFNLLQTTGFNITNEQFYPYSDHVPITLNLPDNIIQPRVVQN